MKFFIFYFERKSIFNNRCWFI